MQEFLITMLRLAVPLLLCTSGALFSEKSGVINIGLEGLMLNGALFGVLGSYLTGSPYVGALMAMVLSMLISLLFAYFAISVKANQIVLGVAINIICSGLTICLNRLLLTSNNVLKVNSFQNCPIPGLSKIPVIGCLFNQTIIAYIAYILVFVGWFVYYKTNIGLKIRAVGDHPTACDTVGINVKRLRYGTVMFSGIMAGLAGAYISTGQLSNFSEDMVSGRGFIAYAAVVFGNYTPLGVFGACMVFAIGMALQYRFQAMDTVISYYFWMMIPYIITIVAMCIYSKKSNAPRFSGVAYEKQ